MPRSCRRLLVLCLCLALHWCPLAWLAPRRGLLLSLGLAQSWHPASAETLCRDGSLVHLRGTEGDAFIVGVTHLSNKSALLVREVVQTSSPDLVMVELDASRVGLSTNTTKAPSAGSAKEDGNPLASMQRAATQAATQLAAGVLKTGLELVYKVFEDKLQTPAGSEMITAIQEAGKLGVPVMLGDRPAQQTLTRLVEASQGTDLGQLEQDLAEAVPELRVGDGSTLGLQALVDSATDQAMARRLRRSFKASAPGLFAGLVGERDEFMAASLARAVRRGKRRLVA
ncbi:unnamed protein product, partial [Effrenium voratum]